MRLPPVLDRLDGPPLSLPRSLDAASERFWRLGPRSRLALTATAMILGLGLVAGLTGGSPWGEAVEVTVAADTLPAGHVVTDGDLTTVRWPAELVPPDAVAPTARGTLTGSVPRGAAVTDAHLGDGGIGALVVEGGAAVGLPLDLVAEHPVGAVLDLVAADGQGGAGIIATGARVLMRDEELLWVEVARPEAAAVAAAARSRTVAALVRAP